MVAPRFPKLAIASLVSIGRVVTPAQRPSFGLAHDEDDEDEDDDDDDDNNDAGAVDGIFCARPGTIEDPSLDMDASLGPGDAPFILCRN